MKFRIIQNRKATQAQQNLITAQSSTIGDSVKELLQEKAEEVETSSQTGFEDLPKPDFTAKEPKDIYLLEHRTYSSSLLIISHFSCCSNSINRR
jgi:hypothetical protein